MVEIQPTSATHKAIYGKEGIKQSLSEAMRTFVDFKGMAKEFVRIQPLYYNSSKMWWAWNKEELKWEMCDEVDILNSVDDVFGIISSTQTQVKTEIIESLRRVARRNKPLKPKNTWVQFKDTIVDIKTSEHFKANPNYFITNPIPHKVGDTEETPVMDGIFTEWVGSDYAPLLYEIIAFCMLTHYPIHRIFCFLGAGMNGKSCYLELVKQFIGKENTTTTELEDLMASRFERAKLHKKLICFMGETNFSEMKKTSILKKLSGGDLIGFEYKNKTPFDEHNYAKLLIATNNLPSTTDKTVGFFRRWVIIDFPQQFDEKKDILSTIPEEEYENLACKCIPLLYNLLKEREFTMEGDVNERMKRFEDRSNPLLKFLEEKTEVDWDNFIFRYDFKEKLDDWCKENNFRKLSSTEINKKLKKECKDVRRAAEFPTKEGNYPSWRAWEGIKWK